MLIYDLLFLLVFLLHVVLVLFTLLYFILPARIGYYIIKQLIMNFYI